MPVISPSAFAPPVSAVLREKVRRLERANSVRQVGKAAVPTGLPAIDALLPEGGLLTGALHEIEAGAAPSGRVAAHDGAALGFAAHLMGRFAAVAPGTLLWCRRPSGVFDAPPYAAALAASLTGVAIVAWLALSPSVSPTLVPPVAQAKKPVVVATSERMQEYLMAHQAYAPSSRIQGGASYIRTISASR